MFQCQPPIELGDRDDLARQRPRHPLDQAVAHRLHRGNARSEGPAVGGQHHRDAQGPPRQAPQDPGLCGMDRQEVRPEFLEQGVDLSQGADVADRTDRHDEVLQDHRRRALGAQGIDEGSRASAEHRHGVALRLRGPGEVLDVDLDPADRIRSCHDVGNSQTVLLQSAGVQIPGLGSRNIGPRRPSLAQRRPDRRSFPDAVLPRSLASDSPLPVPKAQARRRLQEVVRAAGGAIPVNSIV